MLHLHPMNLILLSLRRAQGSLLSRQAQELPKATVNHYPAEFLPKACVFHAGLCWRRTWGVSGRHEVSVEGMGCPWRAWGVSGEHGVPVEDMGCPWRAWGACGGHRVSVEGMGCPWRTWGATVGAEGLGMRGAEQRAVSIPLALGTSCPSWLQAPLQSKMSSQS